MIRNPYTFPRRTLWESSIFYNPIIDSRLRYAGTI